MTETNHDNEYEQQGTWGEWRLKVLSDIKELKSAIADLQKRINGLEVDLAVLNAKAAMYGGGVALIVSAVFGAIAKAYF